MTKLLSKGTRNRPVTVNYLQNVALTHISLCIACTWQYCSD